MALLLLATMAVDAAGVTAQQSNSSSAPAATDPLTKELQRCKGLNEKAGSDPACEAAYKEERRRFFSHDNTYQPAPVDMFPKEHGQTRTSDAPSKAPSTDK
jgi:conjugative transfer region protein TrbK